MYVTLVLFRLIHSEWTRGRRQCYGVQATQHYPNKLALPPLHSECMRGGVTHIVPRDRGFKVEQRFFHEEALCKQDK